MLGVTSKTITVDIAVAKSSEKLTAHLTKLLPPNAAVKVCRNGSVLRDHSEVR